MFTMMAPQIDQLRSESRHLKGHFGDGIGPSGKGDHRTMMIRIVRLIQQGYAWDGSNQGHEGLDDVRVPALTKIRHTFDHLTHGIPSSGVQGRLTARTVSDKKKPEAGDHTLRLGKT